MPQEGRANFKRLWLLVGGMFRSSMKWQAYSWLGILVGCALAIAGVDVVISFTNRYLFNSLHLRDQAQFFQYLALLIGSFLLGTPILVLYSYAEQRFALLWRKWLSRELLERYFDKHSYYRIAWQEGIDNPDQRIEEDIRSLTSNGVTLFRVLIQSILTLVMFIGILSSISWNLLIAVVGYTIIGSLLTYLIGKRLIHLNFTQLRIEGDYRYKLVNVRDNTEAIAFLGSAKKEFIRTRQRLRDALANQLKIINTNAQLGLFVNIYNYLKPVIPIVIVTPAFMKGEIEFGEITQSADAFVRVVEALSIIIQHFGTISSIAALTKRLGSFSEALTSAAEESSCYYPRIHTTEGSEIRFSNVSIYTPKSEKIIIENLNFTHKEGGLLISGPSGRGKTSILRALGGLWVFGSGDIVRPAPKDSLFIPQRPYLILGSLRNQLLYTSPSMAVTDDELEEILDIVGLQGLLKRLRGFNKVLDWSNLLSSGEQQQLSFARFLIKKPKFLFLDEATTALDSDMEERMYHLVETHCHAWMSVGYPRSIAPYHSKSLILKADGYDLS